MSRLAQVAAAVALAGVIAASASATGSTIYPGVGIGKLKLGMTKARVEKILGGDGLVDDRNTIAGHSYLELGWNFDSWSVGFLLQKGRYRAVRIGTTQARQRMTNGIGPGTHWLKLVRAYPHGLCSWFWSGPEAGPGYLLPRKDGTQMLFTFRKWPDPQSVSYTTYAVVQVVVRTVYRPLPEFAPGYEHRCRDGWQMTQVPQPHP
jgi:hypothetical protein